MASVLPKTLPTTRKLRLRIALGLTMVCAALMVIAGLAGTTWWTGQMVREGVVLSSTRSLWEIGSEELAFGAISHGGDCTSSNDCVEGTWCRAVDDKCWTDSDCMTANPQQGTVDVCARLPRTKLLQTTDPCSKERTEGQESERAACNRVHAIRAVAIFAATFAAACVSVAAIPGGHAEMVVLCLALASTGCGLIAILIAVGVNIAGGELVGLGFIFHCCGTCASTLGVAASLRWVHQMRLARKLEEDATIHCAGQAEDQVRGQGASATAVDEGSLDSEGFPTDLSDGGITSI